MIILNKALVDNENLESSPGFLYLFSFKLPFSMSFVMQLKSKRGCKIGVLLAKKLFCTTINYINISFSFVVFDPKV